MKGFDLFGKQLTLKGLADCDVKFQVVERQVELVTGRVDWNNALALRFDPLFRHFATLKSLRFFFRRRFVG